ncbi:hypothetical protein BGX31_009646, partial [Mortierella sp. GBA43]
MDDPNNQSFRTKSSSELVTIPTRYDSKSGQRVVRWKDIQQRFENAKTILNGNCSVLFLTDDDLEDLGSYIRPSEQLMSLRGSSSLCDACTRQSAAADQHYLYNPPRLLYDMDGNMDQQDQLGQLKQQTQQMQQQIEEIHQKTAGTQQQMVEILQTTASMQQQIGEVAQKAENSEHQNQHFQQQIDDIVQKLQQLQERAYQTDRGSPLTPDQERREFSRRQLEILDRRIFAYDRVQSFLNDPPIDPSAPRLFFIIPKNTSQDHTETDRVSRKFRLHFLCECGSHTMSEDSKEPHKVHMTNHPGYDLKRPKEFFDKYRSYILTVMYMVKYGAMTAGIVVPPLLQPRPAGMIGQGQEQDCLTKENIGQLIDDTITHLEEMNRDTDSDTNTQRWDLIRIDLNDVKSYLEVNEGDHLPGSILQLTRLERHYSWVCGEHRYEWTVQHLNDIVNAIGGTYVKSSETIVIKVDSGSVTKQLYDIVTEICMIQCVKDKLPLNMDCGRLSLTTNNSRKVQEVVMTIERLSNLTTDDIEFIGQCNLIKLSIEQTPATTDEDRLINILRQSHTLEELHVGCLGERSLDIIKLIVSTREKALQEGRPTALHTFELMEEGLRLSQFDSDWDNYDHISATLKFSKGSTEIDVDTRMVLKNWKEAAEGDWISNLFRQYGWSISRLNTSYKFNDHLAALLDNSTQIHGSKLTHLVLAQLSLTTAGMDSMDRVVKRSRRLTFFELRLVGLHNMSKVEKVAQSLERFGASLNKLHLYGAITGSWLPGILENFPPRSSLPMLDYFSVNYFPKHPFPHECIPWLVSMVSDPLQSPTIGHPCTGTPQCGERPFTVPTRLKGFRMFNVTLIPEDWETLIKAIDFSVMLELKINDTNFSQEQLDLLLD